MVNVPRISLDRLWIIILRVFGLLALAYEGFIREPDPFLPLVPVWLGLMGLGNFIDLDKILRGRLAPTPATTAKEPEK